MLKRIARCWYVALMVVCVIGTYLPEAGAACVVETLSSETETGIVVHLSPTCSPAEREAHAVPSATVMDAIAKGRPVDLTGVIVRGDLIFDTLAVDTPSNLQRAVPETRTQGGHADDDEQRLVRAVLRIRDSVVLGALRHHSAKGTLRFEGPVDFQGSRFKQGVDLSRSVFRGPVELSGAIFEKEAFFVHGQFAREVGCRETRFGPSTRFHQSTFGASVDCTGALFDGMAEFLEVSFEQPAVFERSRFGSGTGFSGSRFKSRINFGDAIFSRETYFGFAVFESEVVFAGAQFLGPTDFSSAEFRQRDDLVKARFDQPPLLAQTKRLEQDQSSGLAQTRTGQYALTVTFLVVAALLVAYAIRLK
ncbi:MAG: pentapeptide repeat-containing protein [Nitrospira sp.]